MIVEKRTNILPRSVGIISVLRSKRIEPRDKTSLSDIFPSAVRGQEPKFSTSTEVTAGYIFLPFVLSQIC